MNRRGFLRAGGVLAGAAIGGEMIGGSALAAAPAPTEDDLALVQLIAVGKLITRQLYGAALSAKILEGATKQAVRDIRAVERKHSVAVGKLLGGDAPLAADFEIVLPKGAVANLASFARHALKLETTLTGAVAANLAAVGDAPTGALLGQVALADAQHCAWLRVAAGGEPLGAAFPPTSTIENAGFEIDKFLAPDDLASIRRRISR